MPDKYVAQLLLSIVCEVAQNNPANQSAWKKHVEILQNTIKHIEGVERARQDSAPPENAGMVSGPDE